MYNVYQHWDPLKVCIVGKSYTPEFYSFIKNPRVRSVMQRIALETEEDYQKLITLLGSFGVEVLRPIVTDNYLDYLIDSKISAPPMTPRDYSAMIGNNLYFDVDSIVSKWNILRGDSWPINPPAYNNIPQWILDECQNSFNISMSFKYKTYKNLLQQLSTDTNIIVDTNINSAMTTRVGRDLYFGTDLGFDNNDIGSKKIKYEKLFPDYRCHIINTQGHSDGTFCPVKPGLIVSLCDIPTYKNTFPDWEVVYLPEQSWSKVKPFLELKEKNRGKWWVPGEELNDEFTEFVESWLSHWVGYVEETVFDVNMLVIDEQNVVCNNYNEQVFEAFSRHGITPHIVNFRHRYFWDGGLHCITSDIHRQGTIKDYFPERG